MISLWCQRPNRAGPSSHHDCAVMSEDKTGPSHALISMRCLRTKYINVFVTKTCHFRAYGVQVLHDQFVISEIKQGQACNGAGHDTMCVAGAECVLGSCTCKSSVYTADATTGKCSEYKVAHQIHAVQTYILLIQVRLCRQQQVRLNVFFANYMSPRIIVYELGYSNIYVTGNPWSKAFHEMPKNVWHFTEWRKTIGNTRKAYFF